MRQWRRLARVLLTCAVAGGVLGAGSSVAKADEFGRPQIPNELTVSNQLAVVHFTSELGLERATALRDVLAESWSTYRDRLGFPEPPSDAGTDPSGDRRLDLYLVPNSLLPAGRQFRGFASPELTPGVDPAPAFLVLYEGVPTSAVAHELFHAFQDAVDAHEVYPPSSWWTEMTAEWAAHVAVPDVAAASQPLDGSPVCEAPPDTPGSCHDDSYKWWPFVAYLASRFGDGFPREVWARQAELGAGNIVSHAKAALESRLGEHGSTLDAELERFHRERKPSTNGDAGPVVKDPTLSKPRQPRIMRRRFRVRVGAHQTVDATAIAIGSGDSRDLVLIPEHGVSRVSVKMLGGDRDFDSFDLVRKSDLSPVRSLQPSQVKNGLVARAEVGKRRALRVVSKSKQGMLRLLRLVSVSGR